MYNPQIIYDPDKNRRGLEFCAKAIDTDFFIEINGTDHLWDWTKNIIGSLFPKRYNGKWYHRSWFRDAEIVYKYTIDAIIANNIIDIYIAGISAGGAIAWILGKLYRMRFTNDIKIHFLSYASPSPVAFGELPGYFMTTANPGDIVPFLPPWYVRIGKISTKKKHRNFIEAHHDYDWRFKI